MTDIEQVQKQLADANANIKGLQAQLEVTKQMANENLQSNFQLRTNMLLFQQSNQDLVKSNEDLKQQVEVHKTQVNELNAKIAQLQPAT